MRRLLQHIQRDGLGTPVALFAGRCMAGIEVVVDRGISEAGFRSYYAFSGALQQTPPFARMTRNRIVLRVWGDAASDRWSGLALAIASRGNMWSRACPWQAVPANDTRAQLRRAECSV